MRRRLPGPGNGTRAPLAVLLLALASTLLAPAAPAQEACREALALGLDVSGSVDGEEYRLQLDGLAEALADPEVAAALLTGVERPVWLAVYEWSAEDFQRLLIDWIAIASPEALASVTARLRETPRTPAPPTTAIGAAMLYGAGLLGRAPACARRTIDLSGDGENNTGPRPQDMRETAPLRGITVNGLAIGGAPAGDPAAPGELAAYFKANVIHGPGAFVMTAGSFESYAAAMARKLLRELEGAPMTALPPRTRLAAVP